MGSAPGAARVDPRLQLLPPDGRARLWLLALTLVLPVAISGLALGAALARGSFSPWLLDNVPLSVSAVIGLVLVVSLPLWLVLDRAMQRHRLLIQDGALELHTSFYRERVGLDELQLDAARVVDVHEHTGYKPRLKTNGFALPGFQSGWFRLRNRHKALVAGVGQRRALWLPTTRGHGLWLQVRQPQALLDALKDMAQPRRAR
ncbi:MAG: PH domain-containing protein [Proteobacteria bacterium]|nr:PH domain-containing protein [Pseudomonadota bacterium]